MPSHPPTAVLAIIVHNALNGPDATSDAHHAIVNVAVHAWMEGHIEGEGRAGTPRGSARPLTSLPSPPFPPRGDQDLKAIVDEAYSRLGLIDTTSAAMLAAALAYARGIADGAECPGCRCVPGDDLEGATAVRMGHGLVMLEAGAAAKAEPRPFAPDSPWPTRSLE